MSITDPPPSDPCSCHGSFAAVSPTHDGHCCFLPASQTCHPTEVAAWQERRDVLWRTSPYLRPELPGPGPLVWIVGA